MRSRSRGHSPRMTRSGRWQTGWCRFRPLSSADQPIPWLFGLCSGKWILNIDDDEVPSPALIEMLPEIVARRDITHAWIARRWLYPTTDTYLAEPPWSTESQLRLFLADERFMQFSDVFHRPIVAYGPGLFIDAPLWHLDTAVNPVERRRPKATAYEFARPGMRISGRCPQPSFVCSGVGAERGGGGRALRGPRRNRRGSRWRRGNHQAAAGIARLRVRRRYRPGLAGPAVPRHAAPGKDRGRGIARSR